MKQKIKNLIIYFIGKLSTSEKLIPIQNLSIYFSFLIATIILRKKHINGGKLGLSYRQYHFEFADEIRLIEKRFPHLYEIFILTESQIRSELLLASFDKLLSALEVTDEDVDDIISWSYQFLKKDLEKSAFNKIGNNKAKINGTDLLFTTQFFTDKYMVKYLVDEAFSALNNDNLTKAVVIDCASGGGNFLNYSFERLYFFYKDLYPNWPNQKIVDLILNDLLIGYDLDYNLSNIAALSLFVKACKYSIPSKTTHIKIYGGVENDHLGFLNPLVISNIINGDSFHTVLDKIKRDKKIKIFVTNPPFMGKRDMDKSLKDYLLSHYPESKADLCVAFMQRIIQLLNDNDVFGLVSQNSWMYITSLKEFRKMFLAQYTLNSCVDLGSNAFCDIRGEKTSVALCIITNLKFNTSRFYNLKFIKSSDKKLFVEKKQFPRNLIYELNQARFLNNNDLEFNYQYERRVDKNNKYQLYSMYAIPMQGTSTGNNSEMVKYIWEVNGCSDWKSVSKGGGFSKWTGLNYYKVHWGENAEIIKNNKGSALRNISKIPTTQLVYSDTGTLGLNVRVLNKKQVFIASGPGIKVTKGDQYAHIAFLNSRVATFLLKLINPKYTVSAGYISKIPVANDILDSETISEMGRMCIILKNDYLKNKLPNPEFEHNDYISITEQNSFIDDLIIRDFHNDYNRLYLEYKIENEILNKYKFGRIELEELNSVVGRSSFYNNKEPKSHTFDIIDSLCSANIDLNCMPVSRALNGYSIGSESVLELLSYKLDVNPTHIYEYILHNVSRLHLTKSKYMNDLFHKIVLYELGIVKVDKYKSKTTNLHRFVNKTSKKYSLLNTNSNLSELIDTIITNHHRKSFYNKPIAIISNKQIVIGQRING